MKMIYSELAKAVEVFRKYGFNDPVFVAEQDGIFIEGPSSDLMSSDEIDFLNKLAFFEDEAGWRAFT